MKQPAFRVQMRGERKSPFPDRRVAPSQTKTAATTATALTATSRELATGGLLCFNWAKARIPLPLPRRRVGQSSGKFRIRAFIIRLRDGSP